MLFEWKIVLVFQVQREQWTENLADRNEVSYLKPHAVKQFYVCVYKTNFLYLRLERAGQTKHRVLEWVGREKMQPTGDGKYYRIHHSVRSDTCSDKQTDK